MNEGSEISPALFLGEEEVLYLMAFFSEIQRELQDYIDGLSRDRDLSLEGKDPSARLLLGALGSMLENSEEYDRNAILTPKWIGSSFKSLLIGKDYSDSAIKKLLSLAARIVREVTIRRSSYTALEMEILDHYINPRSSLKGDDLAQADYIRNGLPISIQRDILESISDAGRSAELVKNGLLDGLGEVERRIDAYRGELGKLESNYNFVGLTAAFKKLLEEKRKEKWVSFIASVGLGLFAIGIPLAVLVMRASGVAKDLLDPSSWSPAALIFIVAIFGVEVVALYFFRIALKNYQVTRSQITSLQLRNALCAFIEGYVEFRGRCAGKDYSALSGFEKLIFAGLPDGDGGLPSTVDGLAQVTDLIKAARSG